jgi:hypothetical protein
MEDIVVPSGAIGVRLKQKGHEAKMYLPRAALTRRLIMTLPFLRFIIRRTDAAAGRFILVKDAADRRGWRREQRIKPSLTALGQQSTTRAKVARDRFRRDFSMSLRVITGSLSAQSKGLYFQCDCNGRPLRCGISDTALRELIDFHRFKDSRDKALRTLLPEIERLANAKYDAGRFEEYGWLVIWPVDLLRYGYQGQLRSAA